MPCNVEIASEYRYRDSVPDPDTLVVTISQSGETADTLAALEHARALGHEHSLAICNVPESALMRASPSLPHARRSRDRGRFDQGLHDSNTQRTKHVGRGDVSPPAPPAAKTCSVPGPSAGGVTASGRSASTRELLPVS